MAEALCTCGRDIGEQRVWLDPHVSGLYAALKVLTAMGRRGGLEDGDPVVMAIAHNLGNLGYWIRTSKTGKGLMTEASRIAVEFAFAQMELTRLEIVIQPDNWPSRRVAERLGGSLECIARNRLMHRGEPRDAAVYSLVPG